MAVPRKMEREFGRPVKPQPEAQVALWRRDLLVDEQRDEWSRPYSSRYR